MGVAYSEAGPSRGSRLLHHLHLRRNLLIVVGTLVLLAVALQLLATPIADRITRKQLREMEGFRGSVDEVTASVFPPRYSMRGLELWDRQDKAAKEPLFKVSSLKLSVAWRKLLRGKLVASAWMFEPAVILVQRSKAEGSAGNVRSKAEALPRLARRLEEQAPLKVDDIRVADGRIVYQDLTEPERPKVRLSNVDGTLRNLTTRAALSGGEPTTLRMTARLQESGRLEAVASADPWEKKLHFDLEASLQDFQVKELAPLTEASAGMSASKGTMDLFVDVKARDAKLSGGIKPILKNVEIESRQPGLFDKLKAWVADKGVDLLSDGADRTATVIPIEGTVDVAEAQVWPTVFGVVRNAFIEGVSAGFDNLPPPRAPAKEGLLEQAVDALTPGGGPPEAQPQDGEKKKEQVKEEKAERGQGGKKKD